MSDATLRVLSRLGGAWRVVAAVACVFPRPVRDLVYDGVARVRRRLFAMPPDACPLIPQRLRDRFMD